MWKSLSRQSIMVQLSFLLSGQAEIMSDQLSQKKQLFESEPIMKALLSLAVPTIVSQLINLIYSLADTFYIGRTGNPLMLAGVSISSTLFLLCVPMANLFGIGGGSLVARLMGRNEEQNIPQVCAYSFWMAVLCGTVYSVLILCFMDPVLRAVGASDDTIGFCRSYCMLVVVIGMIPSVTGSVSAQLLRNAGYSRQAAIGLSGGGILNIILDPLFMFVIFPKGMEVTAAAAATLLSNILSGIYLVITLVKTPPLCIGPKKAFRAEKPLIREVLSVGLPSAVLPGLFDLSQITLNSLMARHGDLPLAAIGISSKIERLPNAIGIGISLGMLPLVAYNYSAGNISRMKDAIRKGRIMGLSAAALCIVFYYTCSSSLCRFFISTEASADAAVTLSFAIVFMRIRCFASPFQFINYHSSYCLQAVGDGKAAMIHACIRILGIYIPLMYVFNYFAGRTALAVAFPVSEALAAVVAIVLLIRMLKRVEAK